MKKLHGLVFAGALWLAATAPVLAQQAAETRSVVLPANAEWSSTRIELSAGAQLQISTAQARWAGFPPSAGVAAAPREPFTDANGYPQTAGRDARLLLPSANYGALIGRIGENGAPFLVGANYRGVASGDGVLFLSMNDRPGEFGDNTGRLAISVAFSVPPPPRPGQQTSAGAGATAPPAPADPQAPSSAELGPPADPNATPAPVEGQAPPAAQSDTLAPQPTGLVTPEIIRIALIGAAILVGLLILSLLFRPRGASGGRTEAQGGAPQVGARIANSGVGGQSLTIRITGRRS